MRPTASAAGFSLYDDNVTNVISSTGVVESSHRYTAFGGNLETTTVPDTFGERNPWRFSTKYLDKEVETTEGTYNFGYRHYFTALAQWASEDPVGEEGGNSLYEMVAMIH